MSADAAAGLEGREWTAAAKVAAVTALELSWPLSTDELRQVMPWRRHRNVYPCPEDRHRGHAAYRVVECIPTTHVVEVRPSSNDALRVLHQLRRLGIVEVIRLPERRSLLWKPVAVDIDAELLAMLEG